jgi:hypothetical protein
MECKGCGKRYMHQRHYPDRRIRPIVLTMISSGIRLGAWDNLRWRDVEPMVSGDQAVVAAMMTVYDEEPDEYATFVSYEAYQALKEWIDYRMQAGKK